MRAGGIDQFGGDVRQLVLPDARTLAADEALIEVRAAGVAVWDEFVRTGSWDVGIRPPMALGVEVSGVITALGEAVSDWSVGDAVMTHPLPLREQGGWSERLIADGDLLATKPDGIGWEEAAAFPVPALTAYQALTEAVNLKADDTLLVHGAGGVTGRLVVEVARLQKARVIATAGPASAEALASLGVEATLDYHDDRWPNAVRELTDGTGVVAAVNAAPGGERDAISTVADGGRFATITGSPPEPGRGIAIADVYVRADGEQLRELAAHLAKHELGVTVGAVCELARAAEAFALAKRGGTGGAVVVIP
jgi:NADPH:quinone reductase-like Zn-dependent oxidoreductase